MSELLDYVAKQRQAWLAGLRYVKQTGSISPAVSHKREGPGRP